MKSLKKAELKKVQQRLKDLGYAPGPIDGDAGPKTSKAIIAFKRDAGLYPRDKVGPITWAKLFEKAMPGREIGIPPLAKPFIRRLGWQEDRDTAKLLAWFRAFGKVLGNPKQFPWCGEGMENAALEKFPNVPVPSNPFFAQAWKGYGVDAGGPQIGSVGVIRWSARSGHVGVVAAYDPRTKRVTLIGANQGDMIKYSTFPLDVFIGFRVPPSEKGKRYNAFAGTSGKLAGLKGTR